MFAILEFPSRALLSLRSPCNRASRAEAAFVLRVFAPIEPAPTDPEAKVFSEDGDLTALGKACSVRPICHGGIA